MRRETTSMVRLAAVMGLALLAGCTANVATIQPNQRHIVHEQLVLPASGSQLGALNARIIFMADQLERNLDRKDLADGIVVTSFVNLDRLAETTPLGRLIAENIMHELQVRKWRVHELRLNRDIAISEQGEFTLSRDTALLREQPKVSGIVAGTYTLIGGGIVVNARLVDLARGAVISSAQALLPAALLGEQNLPRKEGEKAVNGGQRSMKIVGDAS
ncbi:FlgO family outer membrane protein [Trichlorobacter ammonificans]|uniref:FlgO domain-containing protein n=1 Tax=Trichlorobacter ammonificans TaxID=2916410 RepID=A0ABM9DCL9_9BACT|nr:FlgO family outer membrane protein [Trichlorobacter ammonificans]CAH2032628.1 FlgO domain-containing protein [Trichlorobacter ammonificans]